MTSSQVKLLLLMMLLVVVEEIADTKRAVEGLLLPVVAGLEKEGSFEKRRAIVAVAIIVHQNWVPEWN